MSNLSVPWSINYLFKSVSQSQLLYLSFDVVSAFSDSNNLEYLHANLMPYLDLLLSLDLKLSMYLKLICDDRTIFFCYNNHS